MSAWPINPPSSGTLAFSLRLAPYCRSCPCDRRDSSRSRHRPRTVWEQGRPRHAVLSPTLGRLPPPRETAADLARVMLLLDVSTIARNVGHDLIFATSCCTHSDLGGCADSDADALPARQTTRLCCWHACASVWIATSFRPRPRMHKHANAWWSMHLHAPA